MTDVDTLTLAEFLLARIAEDEQRDVHERGCLGGSPLCECEYPARVMAECEAKRKIVAAYLDERASRDIYQSDDARAVEDERQIERRRSAAARCRGLEIAVEALASAYER